MRHIHLESLVAVDMQLVYVPPSRTLSSSLSLRMRLRRTYRYPMSMTTAHLNPGKLSSPLFADQQLSFCDLESLACEWHNNGGLHSAASCMMVLAFSNCSLGKIINSL